MKANTHIQVQTCAGGIFPIRTVMLSNKIYCYKHFFQVSLSVSNRPTINKNITGKHEQEVKPSVEDTRD